MMVRPGIRAMTGYAPGEQPRGGPVLKLNTNEAPYPPSPKVFEAIRECLTGDRLRKYPDPHAREFCVAVAELHGVDPACVIAGNGSDDILTILTRTFVPEGGTVSSPMPSYLLYKTLAEIQGTGFVEVPYRDDWALPEPWPVPDAHLTFLANPNSPSGTRLPNAQIEALARQLTGPLVIDEAYVDFAPGSALELLRLPNIIITRTLSKSYALAGVRFGYALTSAEWVAELAKVKDSYNCDVLSQVAATAALRDQTYLHECVATVVQTRHLLTAALTELGFDVTPSEANFVWCRHSAVPAKQIAERLKARSILVRYMAYPAWPDGVRITVGSDAEIDRLLAELPAVLEG